LLDNSTPHRNFSIPEEAIRHLSDALEDAVSVLFEKTHDEKNYKPVAILSFFISVLLDLEHSLRFANFSLKCLDCDDP
tara:strand:+ start:595 stop:828 length:234 start_codon:yes stop_codon:yes gene_type:complete